jgi:cutinase
VFVPVLALVISLLIPAQIAGISGCEDAHIIGVRGSGQTNYGEQVGTVVTETATSIRQTGRTVADHALDYPAISISDSFGLVLLNGDYDRSVKAGVDSLLSELDAIRDECPFTQIILIGYSQGSQVIKTAMEDRSPIDRIASVVLLADPTRETTQPGVVRLGSEGDRSGAFGSIMLPDHLRTVAIDVCAVGDGVCGRGGFLSHIEGYADFVEPIVRYVLTELTASLLRFLRPT